MAVLLKFFKSDLGKVLLLLALAVLAASLIYRLGYSEGKGVWKTKHDAVVASAALAAKLQAEAWVIQAKRVKAEQDSIRDSMQAKLDALEERGQAVEPIIKEVVKYVTKKADAVCVVPDGFKWVYNSSLKLPSNSELAGSRPADVDAPTGITISGVAAVAAGNNTECAKRGEVIELWQSWYLQNKQVFERLAVTPVP